MLLNPADLSIPDRYKLLIGGIVPRPIALVSTLSASDQPNLAPFSFFAGVGSNPMTLLFCPATTPQGSEKDSLRNAKPLSEGGTGEFVVNVVPEAIAQQMALCSAELPPHESEWDLSKLTMATSIAVKPARVAESPVAYECRTLQVIRTNPHEPSSGNIVLGEVLRIHIRDNCLSGPSEKLHINPDAINLIGRMGAREYCRTRDRFSVQQP